METASNPTPTRIPAEQQHIHASELLPVFSQFFDKIKVLSLDCFDTLLWRKTITPKDVFFDLQQRPTYKKWNIHAFNRIDAESSARGLSMTCNGHAEVNLADIYQFGFPSLNQADIEQLIEEEIQAEIENCYALPAVIELIRHAQLQGIKVIIVSNTYFLKTQLLRLLKNTLPADVFATIDSVFCSYDYKQSKNDTLFDIVLSQLQIPAHTMLHIGDNYAADYMSPSQRGIHALHLMQFDPKLTEFFRLQVSAATLADTTLHYQRPLLNPFRGLLASAKVQTNKPEAIVGYLSMGPVMYTFARFIFEEIEQLKRDGKRPKVVFLLRDGHLPYLACEALTGAPLGVRGRISRFCAIAASFRTEKDIAMHLTGNTKKGFLYIPCKQLLLPDDLAQKIIKEAEQSVDAEAAFCQLILRKEIVDVIIENSKLFYQRLKKYLLKLVSLEKGDTLVLVDVGYAGRTQSTLAPILEKDLEIEVTGRYLITLNSTEWQRSRRGLIDPSWCDDRTINALTPGNPSLEELLCSPDNSVTNYDNEGNPVFINSSISNSQHTKAALIHTQCLRFIRDANEFCQKNGILWSVNAMRDTVLAELLRRTYFPLHEEISYLQDFLHDEDRGSNLYSNVFLAANNTLADLRRSGLQFKLQEPSGFRTLGLELSLALFTQKRHGLEVSLSDVNMRFEEIVVMRSQHQQLFQHQVHAYHTYEGYFSLWLGIENTAAQIAVLFGKNYKKLQIESIDLIPAAFFYSVDEKKYTQDLCSSVVLNGMIKLENNIYECETQAAGLIIQLPADETHQDKNIFRIVFRPLS